jgi:hypothetical protein
VNTNDLKQAILIRLVQASLVPPAQTPSITAQTPQFTGQTLLLKPFNPLSSTRAQPLQSSVQTHQSLLNSMLDPQSNFHSNLFNLLLQPFNPLAAQTPRHVAQQTLHPTAQALEFAAQTHQSTAQPHQSLIKELGVLLKLAQTLSSSGLKG